jgi:hypothetical protein
MNRRMFGAALMLGAAATGGAKAADTAACPKPSCGGLTEDDLRAYLAKFNARDYAGFSAYYAPDVIFRGQAAQVVGRKAVVDFYTEVHKHIKETVTLGPVMVGEQGIAAELHTHLEAFEDFKLNSGVMKKGEKRSSINFAIYEVKDRQFVRVRTASYQRQA